MNTRRTAAADRREFLRACGRWSALVLLGGGVAALARAGKVRVRSAACYQPAPCAGCAVFARCGLPAARAAREPHSGGAV